MATYTKRGNSYRIRASAGYTVTGKQVQPSMTWTPAPSMTQKQIEKELMRQLVLFDEQCSGWATNGHVKFEEFAKQWFREYAEKYLEPRTIENYHSLEARTYVAIGHLYMDKVTPREIQKFINKLGENGAHSKKKDSGLAPKTIKNYLSFISTVFAYAVKMGMLDKNPCSVVTAPTLRQGEKKCYDLETTQKFLDALAEAPLKYQVFFTLAIFGGYRREELCGFEFSDMDFENCTATVNRVSLYSPTEGIFTGPPKTEKSQRTLKLPAFIFGLIKKLRAEQTERRLIMGDAWHESGRLFTKQDGSPTQPHFAYQWLQRFCKEHDLPFYGIHQFRHLNATLLINNHEDIKTVSAALGHSQTTTTLNIYTHAFATAQAKASQAIADQLPIKFGAKEA